MVHIVIPMGGKGERMRTCSPKIKPLIDVLGVPMIRLVLDHIRSSPEDHLYIVYHEHENLTRAMLTEALTDRYTHVHLIALDAPTRGATETVYRGLQQLLAGTSAGDPDTRVMLMDCDAFYTQDVVQIYRDFSHANAAGAVFYKETDEPDPIYSYLALDPANRIQGIREKEKISRYANTGIYCFSRISDLYLACQTVVESGAGGDRECYLSDVVDDLLQASGGFFGIPLYADFVFNLGTPALLTDYVDRARLFLFDLDGTLVISDAVYYSVWESLLWTYGHVVLDPDMYRQFIMGNSDAFVVENLLRNQSLGLGPEQVARLLDEISREKDRMFLERLDALQIVAGAREFVQRAYLRGHRVGIVTNCNRVVAEAVLAHFGISGHCLVVGGECARAKPFPDPYLQAMSLLGGTPDRVVVFEDSKTGFMSAKGISPRCLVGLETTYDAASILNHGANRSIPDFVGVDLEELGAYSLVSELERNVFCSLGPGVKRVTIEPTKLKGGFIADVLAVTVDLDDGEVLPCVLKVENTTETFCSTMSRRL